MTASNARGLLEEARRLDVEIRDRHRERNRLIVEIAERLARMSERRLDRALGFECLQAYARVVLGYSASKTRALVAIARGLGELPEVEAAARAGEVPWTKLRHVVSVATRETQGEWLKKARVLSNRKLEVVVAHALDREIVERMLLELTPGQRADIDALYVAMQKEQPGISLSAAVAEGCRRAVVGQGQAGGARHRVVVKVCGECERASRETREGSIEVSKAELERAACDSEIVDLRRKPVVKRRTLPPSVANEIDARDDGRCRVPGCSNVAFIERHHQGGWKNVGHDPAHMFLACDAHHAAIHDGALHVKIVHGEPRFTLADGTPLEPDASREARIEAAIALKNLRFTPAEIAALLAKATGSTTAELVASALRAAPMPHAS